MFLKAAIIWTIIYVANANCHNRLNHLSDCQFRFIECITRHAVPVTLCTNCSTMHDELLGAYNDLTKYCSNEYFDKDRINIVTSMETMLTDIWSKAFCDDCINNKEVLLTFADKYQNFENCFAIAKNSSCERCLSEYMDLNNFYISLDQHNNGKVCYDLQDSMNRTRNTWSEMKCCRREKNMTFFALTLGIVSFLPLLFYGSTYMITKRQERNHHILNNDGPTYNSNLPTSSRQYNINDVNNPAQTTSTNNFTSSNADVNTSSATTLQPVHKSQTSADLDSSDDDDIQINIAVNDKTKLINI